MVFPFDLQHRRDCQSKHAQRSHRIRSLTAYHGPFSVLEREILQKPIQELVQDVQNSATQPIDVLKTYGKVALKAHESTNCLTEVMLESAEGWLKEGSINLKGPLAGIPVSLKDSLHVAGYDSCIGYSMHTNKPVFSPMARTLNDLTYFTRSIVEMKPWNYDYTVHPIPWRHDVEKEFLEKKKLRVGIMRTDGVVDPSPACLRAVEMVEDALRREGHEIVEVDLPHLREILRVASLALNSDGCLTYSSFLRPGEWVDAGAAQLSYLASMWRPTRYLYYLWVKYVRRDALWADLVRDFRPQSAFEAWKLVSQREKIRLAWFDWWEAAEVDFLVTPPNATPAVPHDGMGEAVSSCGYTFMFNLLDYSAGVLPVTHVDKNLDQLPKDFKLSRLNGVARGAYKLYDATAMHGLPVGVQVVGRRLEEEKVLSLMQRVEDALGDDKYELLEID
ncbi:putative amidase PB8B6.03 like protein [Verticillium longisporum]|uniref:Putative amidase PB8B6.03 like protein n=1 Tax=Verticillium longisporum TaxID=100787 RepID=A0A8I2ZCM4_VERLO|nr:putative amidase PB8B6.03 like protein [Verticillium longisporum]